MKSLQTSRDDLENIKIQAIKKKRSLEFQWSLLLSLIP